MNQSKGVTFAGAAVALVLAVSLVVVVAFVATDEPETAGCGPEGSLQVSTDGVKAVGEWSLEQAKNAAAIIQAGQALGVPARGQQIAVMTAIGESTLRVLDRGDAVGPDSRGLFQQRDNGAWGSYEDRMNPARSATSFYKALLKVSGWESMEPSLAAHAVQRNADPYHYERFWSQAKDLTAKLTGAGGTPASLPGVVGPDGETAGPMPEGGCGGDGEFSTNAAAGYVGPFNPQQLLERAKRFVAAGPRDPYFNSVSTWYRMCQHFVANMSGRVNSGYATASSAWAHFVATGVAHPADSVDGGAPPPGAWLYYNGGGAAGHVAIYLGGGKVASNDTWGSGRIGIGPASDLTDGPWHLNYLGWAAPWGAKVATKPPTQPTDGGGSAGGGSVVLAHANIPNRSGMSGYRSSMKGVLSKSPDFVTLNEMQQRTMSEVLSGAPGYAGYRDPSVGKDAGAGQTLDTAVLWKASTWSAVAAGRVKLVEDDRNSYQGRVVVWDRFASYVTLRRKSDGLRVSVISVHHMTDPSKYGPNRPQRQAAYGAGMDVLVQMVRALESYGPVLVGGDFNVSASQSGRWAAPSKMAAAGYGQVHTGVDFLFTRTASSAFKSSWSGRMVSDHRWLAAQIGFGS